MIDEPDYDSASEADTGPMAVPVELVAQQQVPQALSSDAGPASPVNSEAASGASAKPATVHIAGKVLRGSWSVIKPSDGPSRQ